MKIFVDKGKYSKSYLQVTNNKISSKTLLIKTLSKNQRNYKHANIDYYDYDYYLSNKERRRKNEIYMWKK